MKRRSFLSLIGAAGIAPVLPLPAGAAPAAAGYNRYMYGLAVFHARSRVSVTAADLVARLRVSATTAEAMLAEMTGKGAVAPAINVAGGALRTVDPHHRPVRALGEAVQRVADWMTETADDPEDKDTTDMEAPGAGQENQDG